MVFTPCKYTTNTILHVCQTSEFKEMFAAGIDNFFATAHRFSTMQVVPSSDRKLKLSGGDPRQPASEYSITQKNIFEQAKVMADEMSRKAYWRDIKAEWTLLAMILDRLFMILYALLVVTFVAAIVIRLNRGDDVDTLPL